MIMPKPNQIYRNEELWDERMLFVRTDGILETMMKAPLILASLILVSVVIPLQTSFSSTRSLDLLIYPDGSAHVTATFDADPLEPASEIDLFGPNVDNFVAVGENGFLLSSEISGKKATIETFGSASFTVEYDIHDLISKEGRIWTFMIDAPSQYSLLMPQNSVIVGMSNLPISMEVVDEQTQLILPNGTSEVNYVLSTTGAVVNPPPEDEIIPNELDGNGNLLFFIISPIVAVGIVASLLLHKRRSSRINNNNSAELTKTELASEKNTTIDAGSILEKRPEMREDDKEIVKFISEKGGQVLESDLRKKFLQPRTTMWRAVKRLERQGIVETEKKDLQNLVKLKKEVDEEE